MSANENETASASAQAAPAAALSIADLSPELQALIAARITSQVDAAVAGALAAQEEAAAQAAAPRVLTPLERIAAGVARVEHELSRDRAIPSGSDPIHIALLDLVRAVADYVTGHASES